MKGKKIFYCELAYAAGIAILALGTAMMEKADFGMSMIVAPAYLLHLKLSQYLPFFSFGMSEYVLQAVLLILVAVVMRKVKKSYFLSFATACIYGVVLDVMMSIMALLPCDGLVWRMVFFAVGLLTCTFGVAFLFRTYFPPGAYELLVKEFSEKFHTPLSKVKTIYDSSSFMLSVVLSLSFFGGFVGISWGTIVCTIFNGWLIGKFGKLLEAKFEFKDALPLRDKL